MSDGNTPLLAYNIWISLPREERTKLAQLFSIPRSGEVIVRTGGVVDGKIVNEVTSDGYTPKDLYAITIPKMQEVTGLMIDDFYKLFGRVRELIADKSVEELIAQEHLRMDIQVVAEDIVEIEKIQESSPEEPKRRGGRPKKEHAD